MPTALFVSPHLDDAIFSAGGLAGLLADRGWRTVLVTAFTRSVVPATGFALACQLDKGLAPDVDYMAMRRREDREAASILSISDVVCLDMLEAPHRGYGSAPALFGAVHDEDTVALDLAARLHALAAEFQPDLVLAPQGLGKHVDHQQVVAATIAAFKAERVAFYRDTPYAIRQPNALASALIPGGRAEIIRIEASLQRKISAAQAYCTQIGFQFGGAEALARALHDFALQEGSGAAAERFAGCAIGPMLLGDS